MASHGNGVVWKAITVIVLPVLFFMGKEMIANEEKCQRRNSTNQERIVQGQKEQQMINQTVLVVLAEIKTDLVYIKSKVR